MSLSSELISIGRLSGLYGLNGWFKVFSFTRPKENILSYSRWQVKKQCWMEMSLRGTQTRANDLMVAFDNITDRDTAVNWVGAELAIQREQLPKTTTEYYWRDLLKLQVINLQNQELGRVTKLLETGANDVLIVEGEQRCLIPWVKDIYIIKVDMKQGIIHVDWQPQYG